MNIVKKLQEIAELNGWLFVHSTDFGQNLFDEIMASRQTVLMIESPITSDDQLDEQGSVIATNIRVDSCQLLRSSDISEPIGNETGYSHDSGRYSSLVIPIIENEVPALRNSLVNCECKLTQFSYRDVYSILDFNLDGVLINFAYECDN